MSRSKEYRGLLEVDCLSAPWYELRLRKQAKPEVIEALREVKPKAHAETIPRGSTRSADYWILSALAAAIALFESMDRPLPQEPR